MGSVIGNCRGVEAVSVPPMTPQPRSLGKPSTLQGVGGFSLGGRGPLSSDLVPAWVSMLARHPWEWFGTFTFQAEVHPEAADKVFRLWARRIGRQVDTARAVRSGRGGVIWVRGLEWQKRGVIHFHALLRAVHSLDENVSRFEAMGLWETLAGGYARIFPVQSARAAAAYVCKYSVKGGEIDFSSNFEDTRLQRGLAIS